MKDTLVIIKELTGQNNTTCHLRKQNALTAPQHFLIGVEVKWEEELDPDQNAWISCSAVSCED